MLLKINQLLDGSPPSSLFLSLMIIFQFYYVLLCYYVPRVPYCLHISSDIYTNHFIKNASHNFGNADEPCL